MCSKATNVEWLVSCRSMVKHQYTGLWVWTPDLPLTSALDITFYTSVNDNFILLSVWVQNFWVILDFSFFFSHPSSDPSGSHVSSTLEKSAESKSQQPFVLAPITSNLDYHNLHFTDLLTFTLALSNVSSTPQPEWNFYFIVLNFLLRYNRHITLYNFKVYNMLIQYIYRLNMNTSVMWANTSIMSHNHFFSEVGTIKIESLSNSKVYNKVLCIITMLCIRSPGFIYLLAASLYR